MFLEFSQWLGLILFVNIVLATRLYTPLSPSVRIGWLVGYILFCFSSLWPHCSSPNASVTSNTAPTHPHVIGVAVYQALYPVDLSLCSLHISREDGNVCGVCEDNRLFKIQEQFSAVPYSTIFWKYGEHLMRWVEIKIKSLPSILVVQPSSCLIRLGFAGRRLNSANTYKSRAKH